MLEEGAQYNSQLWELSILRLNQLNYFEVLKVDQDSESRLNSDDGTVDLLLKLKEKGKNSIGLNGGISGLSGTFIGANYETNNFLGLGETLSVQANIGDLSRNLSFGFTEPYLRKQARLPGNPGLHPEVRLQPGEELRNREQHQPESVERATVAAYQLQPGHHRPDDLGQPAAAAPLGAQGRGPASEPRTL